MFALLPPCPALQVLQRMLGERYMYHKKMGKGDDPSAYRPYYIDMSEPSVPLLLVPGHHSYVWLSTTS